MKENFYIYFRSIVSSLNKHLYNNIITHVTLHRPRVNLHDELNKMHGMHSIVQDAHNRMLNKGANIDIALKKFSDKIHNEK